MELAEATETSTTDPVVETQVTETQAVETSPASEAAVEISGGDGGAVETSGIDAELAALAAGYGIDPAWHGNDPSKVSHAVAMFDRQLAEFGRTLLTPQQQAQQAQAKQEQTAPVGFDIDKLLPELKGEEFDPAIVGWTKQARETLKAMDAMYQQRMAAEREAIAKEYTERVGTVEQFVQRQEAERFETQMDGFFSSLGKEYAAEFGTQALRALPPHSPLVSNRNKVIEEAMALQAGYSARGSTPPPLPTLMKRALSSLYADKQSTIARQQILSQAATIKAAAAAKTADKRSTPSTGREKAAQVAREAMRQLGMKV